MTTAQPEQDPARPAAPRNDPNNASVLARFALLRAVVSTPTVIEEPVRNAVLALITQGRLAAMELPANAVTKIPPTAITRMSLNTLKARADGLERDGFTRLDVLRKQALAALEKEAAREAQPSRGSLADLDARLKSQAEFIQQLVDEIGFIRARDLEYLGHLRYFAQEAGQLDYLLKIQKDLEVKYHRAWVPLPPASTKS
jgi:hypothetical protein